MDVKLKIASHNGLPLPQLMKDLKLEISSYDWAIKFHEQ
jgi:hypothetical protein